MISSKEKLLRENPCPVAPLRLGRSVEYPPASCHCRLADSMSRLESVNIERRCLHCRVLLFFHPEFNLSFEVRLEASCYARFQVVGLLGLSVSAFIGYLGDVFGWHYGVTVGLTGGIVPLLSFLAHRSYTYSS